MKVLVSGSSGLVGSALCKTLNANEEKVVHLVRSGPNGADQILWNPEKGSIDSAAIEGMDGVVHLAGESLASGRWTHAKKSAILNSRVNGTWLLASALGDAKNPPEVFVSVSAVGFYGDTGDQVVTEQTPEGKGFLADVCNQWESAAEPAARAGIRVVKLRIGIVLSGAGGALAKMLLPFKMGVGGKIGSGRQYMSWIEIDDLVSVIRFALRSESESGALEGPVNAASPNPVTNTEFTKTLGKVLSRPTLFPVPGFALRAMFGEMADAALLSGTRAVPEKLESAGFKFTYPELESALRHALS
ncbi:MAG TPA: TIGR01777 family oxidoreductase [Blastocatellia bacterium]